MEQCDIDVDMAYLEINELNPPNGSVKRERELEQSSSSFISPVSDEDNPRRSLRKNFESPHQQIMQGYSLSRRSS